ncbi:MAG: RDD family protein [Myxococcaceae bacterium]|nr:RDD family protein [Myxococcaceae bacterium]
MVDFVLVAVLCAVTFLFPLLTRGLALPMWGVLLVMVGYSVVPLYAFKKTIGLALFKLELVGKGGHSVDAGNLLFRELIGRGFLPIAYLLTVVSGLIASMLGLTAFVAPEGALRLYFVVCGFAAALAVLGHFLVLNRDDRRTLADLFAGSVVRVAVPAPVAHDEEEKAVSRAALGAKVRTVLVLEGLIAAAVFGLPWFLAQPSEPKELYTMRLRKTAAEKQFAQDPADDSRAADLVQMLRALKDEEGVKRVIGTHEQAVAARDQQREVALEKRVQENPADEVAVGSLLDILEEQEKLTEAKALYAKHVAADPDLGKRAGYGRWLAANGFAAEATQIQGDVVRQAPSVAEFRTLYGVALAEEEKWAEAYEQFYFAVALAKAQGDDEGADDAEVEWEPVKAQRGALSKSERKALEKAAAQLVKAARAQWALDGGQSKAKAVTVPGTAQ